MGISAHLLKGTLLGVLIFFMGWMTTGCTAKEDPEITIAGSTTILPFMVKVSEHYAVGGKVRLHVSDGGSIKGIRDLIHGKINIAMSSAPIPTEILSSAESKGLQIKGFPFAVDLIVPIVHPSNPVANLNPAQLAGIYAGKIKTWKDVGGQSESIEVVARRDSSGTGEVWRQMVMKSESVRSDAVLQDSNSGILAYVAEHSAAIGYVSYALLNHEVKPLSVNGVVPNRENAGEGRYPISRRLYLYVNEKEIPHPIKALIVFVLGRKGQQIAETCGFIPLYATKSAP
ncbi:MAG TPA: phosphate ABC transporter substrate-binding protein [Desulfobacteria bacterium]|nr:phosphate ABC transporter substrate-binding protein [Desulfobacteria bacterium]